MPASWDAAWIWPACRAPAQGEPRHCASGQGVLLTACSTAHWLWGEPETWPDPCLKIPSSSALCSSCLHCLLPLSLPLWFLLRGSAATCWCGPGLYFKNLSNICTLCRGLLRPPLPHGFKSHLPGLTPKCPSPPHTPSCKPSCLLDVSSWVSVVLSE